MGNIGNTHGVSDSSTPATQNTANTAHHCPEANTASMRAGCAGEDPPAGTGPGVAAVEPAA
jgi:hypothetical protein